MKCKRKTNGGLHAYVKGAQLAARGISELEATLTMMRLRVENGSREQGGDCGYDVEDFGFVDGACGGERDISITGIV